MSAIPDVDKEFAALNKQNAKRAAQVLAKLIDKTEQQLDAGELRDPAKTAQNLSVSMGITYEKARLAEDKPTQIHSRQDAELSWEQAAKALSIVVESTADEIPVAQIPPDVEAGRSDQGAAQQNARTQAPE